MRRADPPHRQPRHATPGGFTLIELLVGLAVMAILALLSWRALDGIGQALALTRERADAVLQLQTVLGQWRADLHARAETGELPALDFDGRVLRLTRRDSAEDGLHSEGVRVVAWARLLPAPQGPDRAMWARWQSPPVQTRDALARAWQRAQAWGRGEQGNTDNAEREPAVSGSPDTALNLLPLDDWQLFYFRGQTWGNPQSSAGNESPQSPPGSPVPAGPPGVRLVLNPSPGTGLSGTLTIDWVDPGFSPASP